MRARIAAAGAVLAFVVSACSLLPSIQRDAPTPCDQIYSTDQCLAMVDVAAAEVSKNRGDVAAIAIVPDPPPEGAILGGAWHVRVRIALKDGSTHETNMCGGVSMAPACSDEPHLDNRSVFGGGYRDIPCAGEPPNGCPTPFPSLQPAAVRGAKPIQIEERSIAIDRLGPQEVVLGTGSLPNGIVTEASFEFGEEWPDDLALREGAVRLEVRSLEPDGRPFENYYDHGWHPGVERIRAVLTFEVLWFAPGATLEILNVVVR